MRKIIVELETNSDQSIEVIKSDLAAEIGCCCNYFEVRDVKEGKLAEEKLNRISRVVREATINFLDIDKYRLLDLVVSLHNELCKEIEGKYCDYAYHWGNLGYGGSPNDSLFKEEAGEDDLPSEKTD